MSYDNTKFHTAFDAWLDQNVEVGFGEHYAGELLDDFEDFLDETKMMKRGPGRVVFGRRLGEKGFSRRKYLGLTYWSGLKLLKKRVPEARRHKKTIVEAAYEAEERERIRLEEEAKKSPAGRKAKLDHFRKQLEEEERIAKEFE